MKSLRTALLSLAATGAVMASPAPEGALPCAPSAARFLSAADFRQEFVPADASVVLHLDLKNLRASEFGKHLTQLSNEMEIEGLDELKETLGFDPLQEVDSITAYGSDMDEGDFGAVLVASAVIDKALEMLPEQEGYRSVSKAGIDFFQFDDLVGSWHIMESGERLVIVGKTLEIALRGHQVIHGDLPNQSSHKHATALSKPQPGSILYLAGGGELLKQAPEHLGSAVLKLATGAQFEIAEHEGLLKLRVGVQTASNETAQDLREMLGGFLAVGRIMIASEAGVPDELVSLLRSIHLVVEGKLVSLSLVVPAKEVLQMVESMER